MVTRTSPSAALVLQQCIQLVGTLSNDFIPDSVALLKLNQLCSLLIHVHVLQAHYKLAL